MRLVKIVHDEPRAVAQHGPPFVIDHVDAVVEREPAFVDAHGRRAGAGLERGALLE